MNKIKELLGEELHEELYKEYTAAMELFARAGISTIFPHDGTLLGAIRDGGVILGDDDIDFALYRKDYEMFSRYLRNREPDLLFLDETCIHLKIKSRSLVDLQGNPISVVDVFPLDYMDSNDWEVFYKSQGDLMCIRAAYNLGEIKGLEYLKNRHPELIKYFHEWNAEVVHKFIDLSAFNIIKSDLVGNFINSRSIDKEAKLTEWYNEMVPVKFGPLDILIPKDSLKIVKARYGDDCMDVKVKYESHQKIYRYV